MEEFKKLVELCKGKNVFIQTHNFPDPDAIGSAFGLKKIFEHFGVETTMCYEGRIDKLSTSKMLEFLNIKLYSQSELEMSADDPIICVDSQKNGGNITDFIGDEIACIDHHPTFVPVEYIYKDVRIVGACSTIIADYFQKLGITPDSNTATALLYGIKMDTLQFRRGVTQEDISAFAFLNPLCDNNCLKKLESSKMEFCDLKAYGAAIANIRIYDTMGIAGIPFACPDALIAMVSEFILSLQEVDVAVIYSFREDGIKFSVRSERDDVHAGNFIRNALDGLGSGGGHAGMAGGLIPQENIDRLGRKPDYKLWDLFLNAIECLKVKS